MSIKFIIKLFIISTFFFLFSCSGYFNMDNSDEAGGDLSLALADGSGYLSTDNYNEITPFLYRNPDNGKAYLFFASDRDGTYDIYYAEMNSEGKFSKPIKMDTNYINTSGDEFSPVVFKAMSGEFTYTYISFVRRTPAAGSKVYNCQIDPLNFNSVGESSDIGFSASSISLLNKNDVGPSLLISDGNTYFRKYEWDSIYGSWNYAETTIDFDSSPIYGVDGFSFGMYDYEHSFIINVMVENKYRLYGGYYCIEPLTNYLYPIKEYSSPYNDKDPCIDLKTMKVYFASDRYGKGNYDLYRYNILTFDKVMQLPK